MSDFLKRYQLTLKVLTPVHIGSGDKLSKKEFVFLKNSKEALIFDPFALFLDMRRRGLVKEYEKYMMYQNKDSLLEWLLSAGYQISDIQALCSYRLDCSESLEQLNRPVEIQNFVKDAYGLPYVPGSSMKGALRTVLLAHDIMQNPRKYQALQKKVQREETTWNGRPNKRYLGRIASEASKICFCPSEDRQGRNNAALADTLKGLRISDSRPIAKEQLTLCQKIDVGVGERKKAINILRESLKPGTEISFDMLIDTSVLKLDKLKIEQAINNVADFYTEIFVSRFMEISPMKNKIYLGGGSGYGTKTIAYELLDQNQRIHIISNLMGIHFPRHYHDKDVQLGVSPHMLKCTRYGGKLCEMGKCQLMLEEVSD